MTSVDLHALPRGSMTLAFQLIIGHSAHPSAGVIESGNRRITGQEGEPSCPPAPANSQNRE